jgi:N-acetylmuramoyl-L-alanine amidase
MNKYPVIYLDAGHGGSELGAVGHLPGGRKVFEKNLNLRIVRDLSYKLTQLGYVVLLTRESDEIVPLLQRVGVNSDIFISIHFNSSLNKKLSGTESFYHISNLQLEKTKKICECITDSISSEIGVVNRGYTQCGSIDGTGGYMVLRCNPNIISCLIECLFISNYRELLLINKLEFQTKLVNSILNGIVKFTKEYWI